MWGGKTTTMVRTWTLCVWLKITHVLNKSHLESRRNAGHMTLPHQLFTVQLGCFLFQNLVHSLSFKSATFHIFALTHSIQQLSHTTTFGSKMIFLSLSALPTPRLKRQSAVYCSLSLTLSSALRVCVRESVSRRRHFWKGLFINCSKTIKRARHEPLDRH